jgi:hypothetical protein
MRVNIVLPKTMTGNSSACNESVRSGGLIWRTCMKDKKGGRHYGKWYREMVQ